MYTDLVTYCSDTVALLAEVAAKFPDKIVKDSANSPTSWLVTKTPTVRNGLETLSVVRVNPAELADIKTLTSLKILAEAPAGGDLLGAMIPTDRAIYDGVRPNTSPELIGMFA